MDHDSNAARVAAICVFALVGYWAFVEAEASSDAPGRVGPGASSCSVIQGFLGKCGKTGL